ncbi:MAG: ribonuclease HIII [Armatimonadota bacterium]|nr:MAG: ribonuclease HIII [Armatimonadota bacterium]
MRQRHHHSSAAPNRLPEIRGARIGTDEAGKGDYFGYLVIAAVYLEPDQDDSLREMGVRDSKRMSDSVVRRVAGTLKAQVAHDVVRISPSRYNELYAKLRNLNRLLAWGHARAIENLLERASAPLVVSDQFGDEQWLREALMRKGRQVTLVQAPRAEQDSAVAAASILARSVFLETLEALSAEVKVSLPKGSTHVIETARDLWRRGGEDLLGQVAKLHFRVTKSLRQVPMGD